MTGHIKQNLFPLLLRFGIGQQVNIGRRQSPWHWDTARRGGHYHEIAPDEHDGDQVEDDTTDDLLHNVFHQGQDNCDKVGVVAPTNNKRYEYHR